MPRFTLVAHPPESNYVLDRMSSERTERDRDLSGGYPAGPRNQHRQLQERRKRRKGRPQANRSIAAGARTQERHRLRRRREERPNRGRRSLCPRGPGLSRRQIGRPGRPIAETRETRGLDLGEVVVCVGAGQDVVRALRPHANPMQSSVCPLGLILPGHRKRHDVSCASTEAADTVWGSSWNLSLSWVSDNGLTPDVTASRQSTVVAGQGAELATANVLSGGAFDSSELLEVGLKGTCSPTPCISPWRAIGRNEPTTTPRPSSPTRRHVPRAPSSRCVGSPDRGCCSP